MQITLQMKKEVVQILIFFNDIQYSNLEVSVDLVPCVSLSIGIEK